MNDTLTRSFGLVVSLVLPGAVGLFAVAFYVPTIANWFTIAATQPTSVGAFLFLLLASVGMGMILGGARWLLVDQLLFARALPKKWRLDRFASPNHEARRHDAHTEAVYRSLIADHYVYYQFFSTLFVALLTLWAAWWAHQHPAWPAVLSALAALVLSGTFLLAVAYGCLRAYLHKRFELLGPGDRRHAHA